MEIQKEQRVSLILRAPCPCGFLFGCQALSAVGRDLEAAKSAD